ncbi:MAG: DUF4124 domain-containing protein [Pseudomonadota bacterium]
MHNKIARAVKQTMVGLGLGALLLTPAMAGDIYKTVDAQGNVVYQDTPPQDGQAQRLSRRTQATNQDQVAKVNEQLAASRKIYEEQKKDSSLSRAQAADLVEQRASNCEKARTRLEKAVTSRRIYEDTGDGERRYFSSEEQDAYKSKAQSDVDEWCN